MEEGTVGSCERKQRLMIRLQDHLLRIADLSRATAEAVSNGSENLVRELDKQVEQQIGAKERALGALREHREEHGC